MKPLQNTLLFFFNDTATTEIYTLSLHDALPIFLNKKNEIERKQKLAEVEEAQRQAENLKNKEITIKAKSGENGKLFGAITNKDISVELKKKFNIDVDKKKIVMETIKLAGTYDIEVKLYAEVSR